LSIEPGRGTFKDLMGLLDRMRSQPGWKDPDPLVRRAAVRQLADPAALTEVTTTDGDADVREAATGALLGLALEGEDESAGLAALAALSEPKHLLSIARSAAQESVSRAALRGLTDTQALGSVARHGRHAATRLEALRQIEDPAELVSVALKSPHEDAALAALERIASVGDGQGFPPETLTTIAHHAKNKAAARRARTILYERDEASARAAPGPQKTDRRRQTLLCEKVEALARSAECEPLAGQLSAAQDAWTDLIPDIDDDLAERFLAGCRAAREHLARNEADREDRRRRDQERAEFVEQHITPRVTLCELVESAQGEEAPRRLEGALWEWNRLAPLDTPEALILAKRFEEACRDCRSRHQDWEKATARALLEAQEEAERGAREREREERARQERDNAARLERLCDRAERLLRSETLTLARAEPALREVRAALDDTPPLPSMRDQRGLLKRLKSILAALAPRVKELRESETWKRWANANVQENLCGLAEALLAVSDPFQAGRKLADLQKRWKEAGVPTKGKTQELSARFKAAEDQLRSRLEAYHAEQAGRKRALCDQAETLSSRSDWVDTAEAIKRLQAEWKTIGPASRAEEKALWERFRAACDRFFARRKEDLARRKDEWAKNFAAREELCVRVEALVGSMEWEKSAAEIKRLQADWRKTGSVRKNRSEAIWQRFRDACDRFFERYKRRDQIDLEAALADKEGICREIESMLPPAGPVAPENPPDHGGPAGPPNDLLTSLRALRERWQQGRPLPRDRATPFDERFNRALDRLGQAYPEILGGSDFDVDQNRRKMEDLCARVERLLPAGNSPAEAAASPAARLAALWVEAMAANTIGGKVAEEAKWRAAEEDVRRAQAAWQRIGHVPEGIRRSLTDRFDRCCRRILDQRERSRAPAAPKAPRARRR
jgi:uncharacterized protein DUF349